jgi:WD40 repeat protein
VSFCCWLQKTVEWEEFVEYLVERGIVAGTQSIAPMEFRFQYDEGFHDDLSSPGQERTKLFLSTGSPRSSKASFALVESGASRVRLLGADLEPVAELSVQDALQASSIIHATCDIFKLAFEPVNGRLYAMLSDFSVVAWCLEGADFVYAGHVPRSKHVLTSLGTSAAPEMLLLGTLDGRVVAYDAGTLGQLWDMPSKDLEPISSMVTIPGVDPPSAMSSGLAHHLLCWDLTCGHIRMKYSTMDHAVDKLWWNPVDRLVYGTCQGGKNELLVWEFLSPTPITVIRAHATPIIDIVFLPSVLGSTIVTMDTECQCKVWDISEVRIGSVKPLQTLSPECLSAVHPTSLAFVPTDKSLLVNARHFHRFSFHVEERRTRVVSCLFSEPVLHILVVSVQGLSIWDARTGRLKVELPACFSSPATTACLDDRERKVIVGHSNGLISVFNASTGVLMKSTMDGEGLQSPIGALSFNAAFGRTILAASWCRSIGIYSEEDLESIRLLRILRSATIADPLCITMSEALSRIAVGDAQGFVRTFDFESLKLLQEMHCDKGEVVTVDFAGERPALVAATSTGRVQLWASPVRYADMPGPLLHQVQVVRRVRRYEEMDPNNRLSTPLYRVRGPPKTSETARASASAERAELLCSLPQGKMLGGILHQLKPSDHFKLKYRAIRASIESPEHRWWEHVNSRDDPAVMRMVGEVLDRNDHLQNGTLPKHRDRLGDAPPPVFFTNTAEAKEASERDRAIERLRLVDRDEPCDVVNAAWTRDGVVLGCSPDLVLHASIDSFREHLPGEIQPHLQRRLAGGFNPLARVEATGIGDQRFRERVDVPGDKPEWIKPATEIQLEFGSPALSCTSYISTLSCSRCVLAGLEDGGAASFALAEAKSCGRLFSRSLARTKRSTSDWCFPIDMEAWKRRYQQALQLQREPDMESDSFFLTSLPAPAAELGEPASDAAPQAPPNDPRVLNALTLVRDERVARAEVERARDATETFRSLMTSDPLGHPMQEDEHLLEEEAEAKLLEDVELLGSVLRSGSEAREQEGGAKRSLALASFRLEQSLLSHFQTPKLRQNTSKSVFHAHPQLDAELYKKLPTTRAAEQAILAAAEQGPSEFLKKHLASPVAKPPVSRRPAGSPVRAVRALRERPPISLREPKPTLSPETKEMDFVGKDWGGGVLVPRASRLEVYRVMQDLAPLSSSPEAARDHAMRTLERRGLSLQGMLRQRHRERREDISRRSVGTETGRDAQVPARFGPYSAIEVIRVRQLFESADRDGNGSVELEELLSNPEWNAVCSETRLHEMFDAMDQDRSGDVTLEELFMIMFPLANRPMVERMIEITARREKEPMLRQLEQVDPGPQLTEAQNAQLRAIFGAIDTDRSEDLFLSDIHEAFRTHRETLLTLLGPTAVERVMKVPSDSKYGAGPMNMDGFLDFMVQVWIAPDYVPPVIIRPASPPNVVPGTGRPSTSSSSKRGGVSPGRAARSSTLGSPVDTARID